MANRRPDNSQIETRSRHLPVSLYRLGCNEALGMKLSLTCNAALSLLVIAEEFRSTPNAINRLHHHYQILGQEALKHIISKIWAKSNDVQACWRAIDYSHLVRAER